MGGVTTPPGARVAFGALIMLVVGSLGLVALDVASSPFHKRTVAAGLTVLLLMPAVLLGQYAPPPYRLPYHWRWGLLLVQAVLTYMPLVVFSHRWFSLLGFLAGAVLLTLPPLNSVPLVLAVLASGPLLVHTGVVDSSRGSLVVLLSTAITASTVFAVAHLALLASRLHSSKEQTARLTEQRVRAQIRQDLHDLVGSSLVAVVVRAENALRTEALPASARAALTEIVELTRRAQEEVRRISVPGTPRSLIDEFAHVQRLLTTSGTAVRASLPPRLDLPDAVTECLRSLLHEAVANVLEHSRATFCEIALHTGPEHVRLTVRNDGVPTGTAPSSTSTAGRRGTGLVGLKGRVVALGGTLHAGPEDHGFSVTAALPLR